MFSLGRAPQVEQLISGLRMGQERQSTRASNPWRAMGVGFVHRAGKGAAAGCATSDYPAAIVRLKSQVFAHFVGANVGVRSGAVRKTPVISSTCYPSLRTLPPPPLKLFAALRLLL